MVEMVDARHCLVNKISRRIPMEVFFSLLLVEQRTGMNKLICFQIQHGAPVQQPGLGDSLHRLQAPYRRGVLPEDGLPGRQQGLASAVS